MRPFCMYRRPALANTYCATTYSHWPGGSWRHGRGGDSSRYETRRHSHRGGGDFGVRRPLRYLRYHLDLDESQSRGMAAVLNRLKLEREQAQINEKRGVQAVAEILAADQSDDDALGSDLKAALRTRVTNAEHLQSEVARALTEIYAILDADQRVQFADLVASGAISL